MSKLFGKNDFHITKIRDKWQVELRGLTVTYDSRSRAENVVDDLVHAKMPVSHFDRKAARNLLTEDEFRSLRQARGKQRFNNRPREVRV